MRIHLQRMPQNHGLFGTGHDFIAMKTIEAFGASETEFDRFARSVLFDEVSYWTMPAVGTNLKRSVKRHTRPHESRPKPILVGCEGVKKRTNLFRVRLKLALMNVVDFHQISPVTPNE